MARISGPDMRMAGSYILASLVFIAGQHVPLPGLDLDLIATQMGPSSSALSARLSIMALGFGPILNAFALSEIARLIFPRLAGEDDAGRSRFPLGSFIVQLIAVSFAALQGYGLAIGLQSTGLVRLDASAFVLLTVFSFVASTALLLWLIGRIRLPGMRNGFWPLWLVPFFLALQQEIGASIETTRTGVTAGSDWLVVAIYFAVVVGAFVVANRIWASACGSDDGRREDGPGIEPLAILLWPTLLAGIAAGYILMPVAFLLPPQYFPDQTTLQIIAVGSASLLIPVFVFGYTRIHLIRKRPDPSRSRIIGVAMLIAVIEIAAFIAGNVMNTMSILPINLSSTVIIAMTTVMLALGRPFLPAGTATARPPGR